MISENECLLCGKKIKVDEELCKNCQNFVDNHYGSDCVKETEQNEQGVNNSDQSLSQDDSAVKDGGADNDVNQDKGKVRKKRSKILLFFLFGCLFAVLLGIWNFYNVTNAKQFGETEDMYWNICVSENSATAYSKYLIRFPNGKYEQQAYSKIKEFKAKEVAEWESLKKSSDILDYFAYMDSHQNTPYLNEIKLIIDSLAWKQTMADGTVEAYKAYLDNVILENYNGKYSDQAKYRYQYLSEIKEVDRLVLDSIKFGITKFYNSLGSLDKDAMNLILDTTFVYHGDTLSGLALLDSIEKYYKQNKIVKIDYLLNDSSVSAIVDNIRNFYVDLVVDQTIKTSLPPVSKKKKKQEISISTKSDTLRIKMNELYKIISVYNKRDSKLF